MKNKIAKLEEGSKKEFIKNSSFEELDKTTQDEISNDIDEMFEFNESNFSIAEQNAVKKFPLFTKNNQDKVFKFYESHPHFKNRFELAKKKKSFNIDELNDLIITAREEVIINTYISLMDAMRLTQIEDMYKKMELIAKMTKDMKSISGVFGRF